MSNNFDTFFKIMLIFFINRYKILTMVNIFGERLKKLRIKKGYTQEHLASLLNVNRMTIVKWEKGTTEPTISVVRYLGHLLNVEFNYLVGEDKFTLFLMIMAEDFAFAKKNTTNRKNSNLEFAQWTVFWNEILDSAYNNTQTAKSWDEIYNSIGYTTNQLYDTLVYPDDYNKKIIEYIVSIDYCGSDGKPYKLPEPIEDMLLRYENYIDKPGLYKIMLGFPE